MIFSSLQNKSVASFRSKTFRIIKIMYNNTPGKPAVNKLNAAYTTLINVGSTSKYAAIPPHTPAKMRLEERYNFFISLLFFYSLTIGLLVIYTHKVSFKVKYQLHTITQFYGQIAIPNRIFYDKMIWIMRLHKTPNQLWHNAFWY